MTQANPQSIDYPYPTTNTPPLTKHHALIVCGALRRVCSCDDDRDAKEDDHNDVFITSDHSSQKCDDISAEKTEAIDQCPV